MSNVTSNSAAVVYRDWNLRPMQVFPRLCCLEWAVALVNAGYGWFDDGPSMRGIYDSRRGESPCPCCDGFRHDNGFCGQCGT